MATVKETFFIVFRRVSPHIAIDNIGESIMAPRNPNSTSWRDVVVGIRMEPALRERLAAEAERSVRSVSSEIVYRLRKSIENDDREGTLERVRNGAVT
jgi:hypothetical protein